MLQRAVALISATVLATTLTACSVHSSKDNGSDNVRISTPFGGMHVESNKTTATDIGLPLYPGATPYKDASGEDHAGSANVSMSFGSFHLKVQAVSYQTPDSPEKVFAFYRPALAKYGDVLECDGNKPIGQPTVAASGLTCSDDEHSKVHFNASDSSHITTNDNGLGNHNGHQLRAGSPHAFRLVEVDANHPGFTKFGLVNLELPHGDNKNGQSN
jgi:hypothetical protein